MGAGFSYVPSERNDELMILAAGALITYNKQSYSCAIVIAKRDVLADFNNERLQYLIVPI